MKLKPAVFLDRDGTINIDKDYLYRIEDFEYTPNAVEGLKLLQKKGYLLIIITNQSGIARGYYTEDEYLRLTKWMIEDLKKKGITISAVYHCPHHPFGVIKKYCIECECRKPNTELYWRAQRDFLIDMDHSIVIGDKLRDLCICNESDVKGYLLGEKSLYDIALEVADISF